MAGGVLGVLPVRVLLDANVVLALAENPDRLRPEVVDQLAADATTLVISAISPWEIAIKWRTGRLPLPEHPRPWFSRVVREFGARMLPVELAHVVHVADLHDHHGDPFDRLLIAQAQVEGMPIVTTDRSFPRYDVEVIAAR
jgi:PIN domain nuclease of toxin-antitoxin system